MNILLINPVQAHAVVREQWPQIKATLMAGKRLVWSIKEETRSTEQNKRMWAMLNEIADQVEWYGQKLSAEDWKHMFSASLKKQRAVVGLDGGVVVLGQQTSKMTISEMTDLMMLIEAFGAEKGVVFSEQQANP